jgi:hypothetical protein
MLRPINTAEAIALAGDLAGLTDPSDPEAVRVLRLAVHYRERIAEWERWFDALERFEGPEPPARL